MDITNTFICVADDTKATMGTPPPDRDGARSIARLHYDLLSEHPYEYDIDELNFTVFRLRGGLSEDEAEAHREAFFAKGHPCMRASPLTKTYGFGAHYNGAGKIAIYPMDSVSYRKLMNDPANRVEMAMRSRRPSAEPARMDPRIGPKHLHPVA